MDAVKALRQDHDPAEARRLLREYLRLYPHGSLAEEARALSFEAARAAHSPDAVTLANDYLTLYPQGRFRKAAEKTALSATP
jgi:outer membrane protein assembly factor BamD (BamD/ComL family)